MDVVTAMGLRSDSDSDSGSVAAARVVRALRRLGRDVGIPENLRQLGVKREDFETLAANAMKDACGATNPFQPTKEEVIQMLEQAYTQSYS